jgi:hypothetical protein
VRPCNLKPQQRDLTPVLRQPVEPAGAKQTSAKATGSMGFTPPPSHAPAFGKVIVKTLPNALSPLVEQQPRKRLIQGSCPNVVEHCKRHVAHVPLSTLHHFHIDSKCVRKLSRQHRVILFKAVISTWNAATIAAPAQNYKITCESIYKVLIVRVS